MAEVPRRLTAEAALKRLHLGGNPEFPKEMVRACVILLGHKRECGRCGEIIVAATMPRQQPDPVVRCPRCERELLGDGPWADTPGRTLTLAAIATGAVASWALLLTC